MEVEKLENFITVRLLMQGKEVGSIIGKKGDNIKSTREQSGARITISDGSTPERIVTINGVVENVNKAFAMICHKFEDDLKQTCNANSIPPITLRLIVPASQCGSIIGKGGSKIKEIREQTGASIQVASEMLPGSTERAVTVSGKLDSIIECFKQVSSIMLESPPKGDTLSYKPRHVATSTINAPIIFAHGQAFQVQGQYAIPLPPHEVAKLIQIGALSQVQPTGQGGSGIPGNEDETLIHNQPPTPPIPQQQGGVVPQLAQPPSLNQQQQQSAAVAASLAIVNSPQQHRNVINANGSNVNVVAANAAAINAANTGSASSNNLNNGNTTSNGANTNVQTSEMNIPNDLIGCIIGRGGQKISEIRLVSGANIKIADLEDGNPDRHVSITGTPEQIQLAQFLINASNNYNQINTMYKLNNTTQSTSSSTSNPSNPNGKAAEANITSPLNHHQQHHQQPHQHQQPISN